jgi:long-chain acyl-CoA synthetase
MNARPFAWEKSYPPGVSWDISIEPRTLSALFDEAAANFQERTAIEFRGFALSFGKLHAEVDRAARAFSALGLGKGKPLALYLPNVPYHPISFLAAMKIGAPVVHLSPLEAERELAYKLMDSGARVIVTTDFAGLLPNALKMLDRGLADHVLIGENEAWGPPPFPVADTPHRCGVFSLNRLMEAAVKPIAWPHVSPDDIALLQYTGGTTGTPKGAILTHANLNASMAIYQAWDSAVNAFEAGKEIVICVLPLFHIYALCPVFLRSLMNGHRILLRVRFDAEEILHDIEVNRATVFPGVPTMWIALVNRPDIHSRDLSSLRFCGSGGAPLPVEVQARFQGMTGHQLRGGWGMTETAPAGTVIPATGSPPPGTIGLPMPGIEMGIVALDDPLRVLAPGEVGEIRIRGPNVTQGYWNRPDETAQSMAGGYLLTGDIGYMDEAGYFFIVDRKKDMIISGGFNVYPQMIEQAIYEHRAVEEVLVIGVPDPYRGEAAKAFVKLKNGAQAFTLDELKAFLADKIGRHEMPAFLEIRAFLPRTAVGKLSKVELRDEERRKTAHMGGHGS